MVSIEWLIEAGDTLCAIFPPCSVWMELYGCDVSGGVLVVEVCRASGCTRQIFLGSVWYLFENVSIVSMVVSSQLQCHLT